MGFVRALSNGILLAGVAVWLILAASGALALVCYGGTPGRTAEPPQRWPRDSGALPRDRYTLLMALHPQRSCSHASLEQLSRLVAQSGDRAAVHLLLVPPGGLPAGWEKTRLWEAAAKIPSLRLWSHPGGIEAGRFRASVSGQEVLYSPAGRLVFSGGITAARGHTGDNARSDAVLALSKQKHEEGLDSTPLLGWVPRTAHGN
jgi:hypothetical protein